MTAKNAMIAKIEERGSSIMNHGTHGNRGDLGNPKEKPAEVPA